MENVWICFVSVIVTPMFQVDCVLTADKYASQFGSGIANPYSYYHDEDESSFQLVDTARIQKPIYQRGRVRFNQVFLVCAEYGYVCHIYDLNDSKVEAWIAV
jgi:hypothetical protein